MTYRAPTEPDLRQRSLASLAERATARPRVWLAYMPDQPRAYLSPLIDRLSGHTRCDTPLDEVTVRLVLYAVSPICCTPPADAAPLTVYGGVALRESEVVGNTVTLEWTVAPDVPLHTYSVALHVVSAAGEKIAQADYGLPPLPYICQPTELALEAAPPGTYTVLAGVYAWQTGERLVGTAGDGAAGDMLPVATFTVGL
jgi:hypothetical protein